jgi:hypothetical protein
MMVIVAGYDDENGRSFLDRCHIPSCVKVTVTQPFKGKIFIDPNQKDYRTHVRIPKLKERITNLLKG